MEITTTDLSKFGHREREMAEELLRAWREQGLPKDFYDDEVTVMMNTFSGNVFLTNADYQVAMMNDDKLESFYSCPICGHEGFLNEMNHNEEDEECQEYLKAIKEV
jgi:uncharacterized protein YqgQ